MNGYTFVLHDCNNYFAMLSILMNEDGAIDIEDKLEKSKGDLQMLLLTIYQNITSLYREMTQQTYYMTAVGKDFFDCVKMKFSTGLVWENILGNYNHTMYKVE